MQMYVWTFLPEIDSKDDDDKQDKSNRYDNENNNWQQVARQRVWLTCNVKTMNQNRVHIVVIIYLITIIIIIIIIIITNFPGNTQNS